jgi:hypothetical protein
MILEHYSGIKNILILVFVILLLGGVAYLLLPKPVGEPEPVFCTQEAKLCPDGSYVGRTGPKCEFTACPGPANEDPWKEGLDAVSGVSFRYPEKLTTKYISTVDWPPKIAVTDGPLTCTEAGVETARAGQTVRRTVDDREYCVTRESEGAAGSIYTNYAYATQKDDKVLIFTFSLRAVQCANYDDPQKAECENERTSFDIDSVLDRIAQSATIR